jgi:hypothetical protein
MFAPAPGAVIEVDDGDEAWVTFLRELAEGGLGEITEDAKSTKDAVGARHETKTGRGSTRAATGDNK